MGSFFLLVDYENVQTVDLSRVPEQALVKVFLGASQNRLPRELVKQAQPLGTRLEWIEIDGQGSNALDFHIAFYLGEYAARAPKAQFVVLSRDKGFDPLVRHLVARGIVCRRVASQSELGSATPRAPAPLGPNAERVLELLGRVERNRRPRRRGTLVSQVSSYFQKKLSDAEVEALVDQLVGARLITESNKALTYHF